MRALVLRYSRTTSPKSPPRTRARSLAGCPKRLRGDEKRNGNFGRGGFAGREAVEKKAMRRGRKESGARGKHKRRRAS